jgi:hypothetical protein
LCITPENRKLDAIIARIEGKRQAKTGQMSLSPHHKLSKIKTLGNILSAQDRPKPPERMAAFGVAVMDTLQAKVILRGFGGKGC